MKQNNIKWPLEPYFIDFNEEDYNCIYFDEAIKYLRSKHGKYIGTEISKQKTFWEWYKRITKMIDARLENICKEKATEKTLYMEVYIKTLRSALQDYNLTKAVTDLPFISEKNIGKRINKNNLTNGDKSKTKVHP